MSSITSLQNLGRSYKEDGHFDIGVKIFTRVIELRLAMTETIDEIEIILCKSHLASCYRELGKHAKSLEI
jgi:hypothetical protein